MKFHSSSFNLNMDRPTLSSLDKNLQENAHGSVGTYVGANAPTYYPLYSLHEASVAQQKDWNGEPGLGTCHI